MNPANEALLDALSETAWSARSEAALQDDSVEIIRGVISINWQGRQLRLAIDQARWLRRELDELIGVIEADEAELYRPGNDPTIPAIARDEDAAWYNQAHEERLGQVDTDESPRAAGG